MTEKLEGHKVFNNADLQTTAQWANDWLALFNARKSLSMVIFRKLNPIQNPSFFMNDTIIERNYTS